MIQSWLKKIKSEYRILTLAGLISIACGVWENFQQLWLENYGFSIESIADILGVASFGAAIICLVLAWRMKFHHIKLFVAMTMIVQITSLGGLFLLGDMPSMAPVVRGLAIISSVGEKIMFLSIWPLMSAYRKDNDAYGAIGLVEYVFRDIGVLMGGIFIGRTLGSFVIGYDVFLGLAILFYTCALGALRWVVPVRLHDGGEGCLRTVLRQIIQDKILGLYFIYYSISRIAYCSALGLKMLIFTNVLSMSPGVAVNYVLILGIIADAVGVICLRWLTPRNDYVTVAIKFGGRFLLYLAACLTGTPMVILAAMTYGLIVSRAFDNRTEAPYINRIKCQGQFSLMASRRAVRMLSESVGMALVGAVWILGFRYVLGLAAVFVAVQIVLACALIYLREKTVKKG